MSELVYHNTDKVSEKGEIKMNRFEESKEVFNKLFGELPDANKEIDHELMEILRKYKLGKFKRKITSNYATMFALYRFSKYNEYN